MAPKPFDFAVAAAVAAAAKAEREKRCQKSTRGVAVYSLIDDWTVVGTNGPPGPFRCTGTDACRASCRHVAVHAETRAIFSAVRAGLYPSELVHVKVAGGVLVPSGRPSCVECSKLIMDTSIMGVWLYHEKGWRCYTPLEFHKRSLEYHGFEVGLPSHLD